MLENCVKIMFLHFTFDACPMHSPFGFVRLTHQNKALYALFCQNSLTTFNEQLFIYDSLTFAFCEDPAIGKPRGSSPSIAPNI